jgi:hypothetical protein
MISIYKSLIIGVISLIFTNNMKKRELMDNIDNIKKRYTKNNYIFFETGDYNVNISIFRNKNIYYNSADDKLVVIYKKENKWKIKCYKITCDPTPYYRQKFLFNPKGASYIKEGQYINSYKLGIHRGFPGLIQYKPISIYRDYNKDLKFDKMYEETGIFNINIHGLNPKLKLEFDIASSAGCITFLDYVNFIDFIEICKEAVNIYGNSFTITVFQD